MDSKSLKKEFERIYGQFASAIFRFCYLRVSSYELAQDLSAETFLKFWQRLSVGKISNPRALLYTIAHGLIVDYYRRAENKRKLSLEKIDPSLLGSEENLEENIISEERLQEVFSALQKVKKEYREILILHYVEDFTISEVAEILGKKENGVRVLLHRSLVSVKGKL